MKMKGLIVILTFFAGFALARGWMQAMAAELEEYCYNPYGEYVVAEHYVDYVVLRVVWEGERGEIAWSEWEIWEDENGEEFSECLVTVPRPKQILGDPDMDALGHEVLHCLIGSFHK